MLGHKKSIFATYGTDPVADTTAPAHRPIVEAPVEVTETGVYDTDYDDAELYAQETYRLMYQIRLLLLVLVVLKIICLIKD